MIKLTFLLGIIVCLALPLAGQETMNEFSSENGYSSLVLALNRLENKTKDKAADAQKMYDDLGYAKSANMFKSATDVETEGRPLWTKLANAARLNANYKEAAYWYSKVTQDGPTPEDLMHYAQALQATGNCEEAVKWFKLYNETPAINKIAFVNNCNEVDQFTNYDMVTLNNLADLNTKNLDFSARPYKDGLVFTSNRGGNIFSRLIDNWTNNGFTDLYYTKKNEGAYTKPSLFDGGVNGKFHDGVATFSNDDTVMFFTRNNKSKKNKNEVVNLKIYEVTNSQDEQWSAAKELPFNSEDFSNCHPTVSEDGTTMYFSSDRPGGFGGMDIYKVVNNNGEWTTPENCGPSINTAGNEVFPFLTAENDLAFSSNGHPGMGGLDIFVARQSNPNSNNWDRIVNAGKPFNTIKDNFGFYMNDDRTEGYISTSVNDETNNDDIQEWNSETPVDFFPILSREQVFCVVDKKTGAPLTNASINIKQKDQEGTSNDKVKTDSKGQFVLTIWPTSEIDLNLSKKGYDSAKSSFDFMDKDMPESECLNIEMKKEDAIMITGKVVDETNNKSPLANATVTLSNTCNDEKIEVKSNRKGLFNFNVPCGCDYKVTGAKSSFSTINKSLKGKTLKCNQEKNLVIGLKKPVKRVVKKAPRFEGKELNVGMIIPIRNINYDYNKSNIRPDAAIELDRVLSILNQYPSMKVELGSHTDSRGNASYNENLSASRASSAMQYLISKGISRDRVSSRGYGETSLLNNCADNTKCSDEEHEVNRRTEVKIVNLNK